MTDIDHEKLEKAIRMAVEEYEGDEMEVLDGEGYSETDILRAYLDKCQKSKT